MFGSSFLRLGPAAELLSGSFAIPFLLYSLFISLSFIRQAKSPPVHLSFSLQPSSTALKMQRVVFDAICQRTTTWLQQMVCFFLMSPLDYLWITLGSSIPDTGLTWKYQIGHYNLANNMTADFSRTGAGTNVAFVYQSNWSSLSQGRVTKQQEMYYTVVIRTS